MLTAAGAPVAAAVVLAVPALASSPRASTPSVSWRVEGVHSTLLATRQVSPPASGSITKGGAPQGACPADSAAGALNRATHGRWNGTYSKGLGILVTRILGETNLFAKGHWWELFVNDRSASVGICSLHVRAGDQLLFAAVPSKGAAEHPIVLSAPAHVKIGQQFQVSAFFVSGNSHRPVAGVGFAGRSARTNAHGVATLTVHRAGRLLLVGSKRGEIRSAATSITITH